MFVFRAASTTSSADSLNVSAGGELSRSPRHHAAGARSLTEAQAALRTATHTHAVNGRLVAEHVSLRPSPPRHVTQKGGRGLIVQDSESTSGSSLNRVDSKLDTQPALSLFIRYWSAPAAATNPT